MRTESYRGEILSIDAEKTLPRGVVTEFTFQAKDKVIPCVVWGEVVAKCGPHLKPKLPLVIRGQRDLSNALKVSSYQTIQIRLSAKTGFDADGWAAEIKARHAHGQRLVYPAAANHPCFERADGLISHAGKIKRKIEFAMDVLGPEYVNQMVRTVTVDATKPFDTELYKRVLSRLVEEAKVRVGEQKGVSWF